MKFGGTSVENAGAIRRVASIVAKRIRQHPVVVVSAMGKTTDRLVELAEKAAAGRRGKAHELLKALRSAHLDEAPDMEEALNPFFQELGELVKGLSVLGELTARA